MKKFIFFFIAIHSIFFYSCKKDENKKTKFGWVKSGNKLYYDYNTSSGTIHDFRYLEILDRFYENDPTNSNIYETMFRIIDRDLVVKKGGIYGVACENCSFLGCIKQFDYLYAPNAPSLNQEIPQFSCSKIPNSYKNKIIEINKTVTVPKGTFSTYVMLLENGDKSYWNADEGLIMYDRYDYKGNLIGSLKLNRIVR